MAGANLAVVGRELLQFGQAEPVGPGRFRLSKLLRGRGGTEWAATGHSAGEPFVLLQSDALQRAPMPLWVSGSTVTISPVGSTGQPGTPASVVAEFESLRPPSPAHVRAVPAASGGIEVSWARRSRRGWAWIDGIDAPLGERAERYLVALAGNGASLEREVTSPGMTFTAAELAPFGAGAVAVQVRQAGDWGLSRAGEAIVTLS